MPEGALVNGRDDDDFRVRPLLPWWVWLLVLAGVLLVFLVP